MAIRGIPVHHMTTSDGFSLACMCRTGHDHDEEHFDQKEEKES